MKNLGAVLVVIGFIVYFGLEARVLIERWRREYNTVRPHSSLGYRAPAPETIAPCLPVSSTLQPANTGKKNNTTHQFE